MSTLKMCTERGPIQCQCQHSYPSFGSLTLKSPITSFQYVKYISKGLQQRGNFHLISHALNQLLWNADYSVKNQTTFRLLLESNGKKYYYYTLNHWCCREFKIKIRRNMGDARQDRSPLPPYSCSLNTFYINPN